MVELAQVTQLVDDHVVDQMHRQERELGVEIEILFTRTAPPPRFHPLELYTIKIKPVVPVIHIDPVLEEA